MMYNMEKIIHILKSKNQKQNISDSYMCKICCFILNNPYQTECGCLFCKDCIEFYIRKNKNCPGNYEECKLQRLLSYNSIKEDKARAKEIAKMQIKCIYEGCDYKNELNKMNDHLFICEYQVIECDLCKEFVKKINIREHKEMECKEREVICEYCQKKMKSDILVRQHNNPEHEDLCVKYIDKCPYNCDNNTSFIIFDHRTLRNNNPLKCPFQLFGCENIIMDDKECHLRNFGLYHSDLLNKHFNEKKMEMKKLCLTLKKLNLIIMELKKEKKEKKQLLKLMKNQIFNFKLIIFDDSDDYIILRNGRLRWIIKKITNLFSNAKSGKEAYIVSEPFYTRDFGYKLRLKMYPNGYGGGKGVYVSLFLEIMKGDYDAILEWPLKTSITLSLNNYSSSLRDHSKTFNIFLYPLQYNIPKSTFNFSSECTYFITIEHLMKHFVYYDSFVINANILH